MSLNTDAAPAAPANTAAPSSQPDAAAAQNPGQPLTGQGASPASSQTPGAPALNCAAPGAPAATAYGAALTPPAASSPAAAPAANPPGPGAAASLNDLAEQAGAAQAADPDSQPITDWGKVDLQLGSALIDPELIEGFGQAAIASGLTPAQARAIAQSHVKAMQTQAEGKLAAERKTLNDAWGKETNARLGQIETFCSRVERIPGCENFTAALKQSGAASSAKVMLGLYAIAKHFSEDSRGRFISGGLSGKETALEGIEAAFGLR